jgi:hypothetical protein
MQSLLRSISSLRGAFTSSSRLTSMRAFSETAATAEGEKNKKNNLLLAKLFIANE